MNAARDALAGEAVVAGRAIQTVECRRNAHRRFAERLGRGAVQDDRVMQLAAARSVGEERRRVVHFNRPCTTRHVRSKTSSGVPLASMTSKRFGSYFASAR